MVQELTALGDRPAVADLLHSFPVFAGSLQLRLELRWEFRSAQRRDAPHLREGLDRKKTRYDRGSNAQGAELLLEGEEAGVVIKKLGNAKRPPGDRWPLCIAPTFL